MDVGERGLGVCRLGLSNRDRSSVLEEMRLGERALIMADGLGVGGYRTK
jgi:hypothetical protein